MLSGNARWLEATPYAVIPDHLGRRRLSGRTANGARLARRRPPQGTHTAFCGLGSVSRKEFRMNNIIYIVGLVVVVIAVLGFFGLR